MKKKVTKVLLLPLNVSSILYIYSKVLKKNGIYIYTLLFGEKHKYHSDNDLTYFKFNRVTKNPISFFSVIASYSYFVYCFFKVDASHFIWDNFAYKNFDLFILKKFKKPIFISWVGSELRRPNQLGQINEFYKNAFQNGYEYVEFESEERSLQLQKKYSKFGAIPIVNEEMQFYIDRQYFNKIEILPIPYLVKETNIFLPNKEKKLLIVHSPTAKVAKGSNFVIKIIEKLQTEFEFDFELIHDMSRHEALQIKEKCDIFLDQFIIGFYGVSSIEALAMGKPVCCFIHPEFEKHLPEDCPIINASPDSLYDKLRYYLLNRESLNEIGIKSREFALKHHDSENVGIRLMEIYNKYN